MRSPARLLIVFLLLAAACGGGASGTTVATTTTGSTTTTDADETSTTAPATGQATVESESEVQAGTEFEVTWTGPDNEDDYITIVPAGADDGTFHNY
ncbi:MAG TPA: hypothetical protein VJQ79_12620, partial [Acidimicrobiia bacterium]|nr:hypothetical protein [Acidimicrobiia bacterium]